MSAITMQEFLRRLGIDPSNFEWQQLATCKGSDTNLFFEGYESDPVIAREIDTMCEKCPVVKECYEYGTKNKLFGVYGGFYLFNGQVDKKRNEHKDKDLVMRLAGKIYD